MNLLKAISLDDSKKGKQIWLAYESGSYNVKNCHNKMQKQAGN